MIDLPRCAGIGAAARRSNGRLCRFLEGKGSEARQLKAGRTGARGVSRDLSRCLPVPEIAATLQQALDRWRSWPHGWRRCPRTECGTSWRGVSGRLGRRGRFRSAGHQWVDGSAYVNHVELVRKARGRPAALVLTDPLVYQGGSTRFSAHG